MIAASSSVKDFSVALDARPARLRMQKMTGEKDRRSVQVERRRQHVRRQH